MRLTCITRLYNIKLHIKLLHIFKSQLPVKPKQALCQCSVSKWLLVLLTYVRFSREKEWTEFDETLNA